MTQWDYVKGICRDRSEGVGSLIQFLKRRPSEQKAIEIKYSWKFCNFNNFIYFFTFVTVIKMNLIVHVKTRF